MNDEPVIFTKRALLALNTLVPVRFILIEAPLKLLFYYGVMPLHRFLFLASACLNCILKIDFQVMK